jgi:hypothetical protein
MKGQRQRQRKVYLERKQRRTAHRRQEQAAEAHDHFVWVMSLERDGEKFGKTTLPELKQRKRNFARPVIDASGHLLRPRTWFERERQRQKVA